MAYIGPIQIWYREGYTVTEVEYDHDLHSFAIILDEADHDEVHAEIVPGSIDDMQAIIEDLHNGEGVEGWEDGNGNTITIPSEEKD